MGMTGMLRASAAAISIATKSSGLSSRRLPVSSFASSQLEPMTTRTTSHRRYLAVQIRYEVNPRRDAVDIHKEIFLPERLGEPIMQPTGCANRIFTAVINENRIGHGPVPGLTENSQILLQDRSKHYEHCSHS